MQQQQMRQQQMQQQQQAQGYGQQQAGNSNIVLQVGGCQNGTVGTIVRGNYALAAENHGKPVYKKDQQVNGLDVLIYFWDDRDGPNFGGWWFGPKVGGDQVWAYNPNKASPTPPGQGWKVPYDGPVDPTFAVTNFGGGGAQQ